MKNNSLDFKTAFNYPFNRPKGMLNVLWFFLPIFGWFALGGYGVRIIQEFSKGKFKQLPILKFSNDFKLGFFMFLKSLPFALSYLVILFILESMGLYLFHWFFNLLVIPILTINFMNKQTVASFFEFRLVKKVFSNFKDYILVMLKGMGLGLVFLVLIFVLVGIPGVIFTQRIFMADFYRRNIK